MRLFCAVHFSYATECLCHNFIQVFYSCRQPDRIYFYQIYSTGERFPWMKCNTIGQVLRCVRMPTSFRNKKKLCRRRAFSLFWHLLENHNDRSVQTNHNNNHFFRLISISNATVGHTNRNNLHLASEKLLETIIIRINLANLKFKFHPGSIRIIHHSALSSIVIFRTQICDCKLHKYPLEWKACDVLLWNMRWHQPNLAVSNKNL